MRALVTAASRHGSTAGIAEAIASDLRRRGIDATVRDPDDVQCVSGYDVVIIGSAVYTGHWLAPAKQLIERHASALRWRDVWLFSSGPLGEPPCFEGEPVDVVDLISTSGARGHALFAGSLDPRDLGFGERILVRAGHAPSGDYRDWRGIDVWVGQIVTAAREVGTSGGAAGPLVPVSAGGA